MGLHFPKHDVAPVGNPRRILLVRLSAIGDAVHALHGLAALRAVRPDAFVGWLVEDKAATLLEGHPDLDRVHVYPRRRWRGALRARPGEVAAEAARLLAEIRAERYDVAVDLQGNLKSGVFTSLSGAPIRIGLAKGCGKEANHLFVNHPVSVPVDGFHRVDRVLALLAPLGVTGPAGRLRAPITAADREEVEGYLREAGLATGGYAVLHPGASARGREKRWPADRYGRLAALLYAELGLPSVVTWGPGERPLAEETVAASAGAARVAPPLVRLTALAEFSRRAGLFVAADTGALHLAALLGTPTVGLYGPKHPAVYAPRGARTAFVYRGGADPVPMTTIEPEHVLAVARRLLAGGAERDAPWPGPAPAVERARPAAGRWR